MSDAKILIVDDTRANLVAMQALLKNVQADIITANHGIDAVRLALEHNEHIALILLDIYMPEMDGFAVARQLRDNEVTRSLPIIFVTANQDDMQVDEAYQSGAVDYIQKPVRKSALLGKVTVFLDLWALRFGLEREILQRRAAEGRVEHLATHDPLTNLPNRRGLFDELDELIYRSERYKYCSAILFIDLDGFKRVNDQFGHEAGDQLLTRVAAEIKSIVRQTDTVARIGGDEFIVLITDIGDESTVTSKIDRLLAAASRPFAFQQQDISVTASIGISLYPQHGESAATLLYHADQAMQQAKCEGRNNFHFFTEEINRKAHRQRELQENLQKALADDEFDIFFQPIVDASNGNVVSAEALLRWHSAALGQVFPDEFIPAAEASGLISDLGCWVLRNTIATVADWQNRLGISLRAAVNASTIQFRSNQLLNTINDVLQQHNWDSNLLEVEITEGLLLDDSSEVNRLIDAIVSRGVRLSVDDFGTGYSALSYLKNYPVSTVKIDRSFVKDLPDDNESAVLVQAIIAMAHGLRLEVIAEGVETHEQWSYLRGLGCDLAQGYYFGKPMPRQEFENYLCAQLGRPARALP